MELIIGNHPEQIAKAREIRQQVFVVEQGIPQQLDLDGLDEQSHHALITDAEMPVATARLSVDANGHAVMARVAVVERYRGSGLASKVVKALLEHARSLAVSAIEIHAHEYLRSYYERFGFVYVREVEVVGEHQLIEMVYSLQEVEN